MNGRRRNIITFFMVTVCCSLLLFGCANDRKPAQEKKPVVMQEETHPVSAADQEAFRKKLAGLGIPLYKGAKFVEVKKKAKDSPLLVALYEISGRRENDFDKVKSYYAVGLKKALLPKGWVEAQAGDNVILYRKGFEIFFVEFSRVIVPPDTKKIRVAFQYGK
jgi:hypothetical protein